MEPKAGSRVPQGWGAVDWSAPERATVSLETAAKVLGVGERRARQMAADGTLHTIRVGRFVLVPKAAVERLLANGTT